MATIRPSRSTPWKYQIGLIATLTAHRAPPGSNGAEFRNGVLHVAEDPERRHGARRQHQLSSDHTRYDHRPGLAAVYIAGHFTRS